MNRFLREPLLYFLLGGGVLFFIFSTYEFQTSSRDVVSLSESQRLEAREYFVLHFNREPSASELHQILLQQQYRNVLFKEALSHGLHKEDREIQKRLRDKMTYLLEYREKELIPSDTILQRYDEMHPRFEDTETLSFVQVCLKSNSGEKAISLMHALLTLEPFDLNKTRGFGEACSVEYQWNNSDESTIQSVFGHAFSIQLREVPQGVWHGPLLSNKGLHYVYIYKRTGTQKKVFKRDEVLDMWREADKRRHYHDSMKLLMQNYVLEKERS